MEGAEDDDASARAEAIEYWCGLSFVHETSDGPSDETNLLAMREKYSAGELAGDTLIWTEDFDDCESQRSPVHRGRGTAGTLMGRRCAP
eukprot:COSAG04_NODE_9976_length_815_cov_9.768156_1_plen_88_part_10